MRKALEEPLKQIAINAGYEGGVIIEKVRGLKANEGFNAATGEYGDMFKFGVPDPAKVTRSALQNAASIAALFLTTEAVIAEKPEKAGPAMPGGMPRRRHGRHGLLVPTGSSAAAAQPRSARRITIEAGPSRGPASFCGGRREPGGSHGDHGAETAGHTPHAARHRRTV